MRGLLSVAVVLLAVGCSSNGDTVSSSGGAVARYRLSATGATAWDAMPFPNDLQLGADGRVALDTLPRDAHGETVWQATLELLHQRKGFCATCSVYFPIDGELDGVPGALDKPSPNDAILFVDLQEKKLLPVRAVWNAEEHSVAVRPGPGNVLVGKRRYAVALTTAIRARDGKPLRADAGFSDARVTAVTKPGLDALAALGVPSDRIAALTTFTVDDVSGDTLALRAIAKKAELPVATVDKVFTDLDALLGVPNEPLVGRRPAKEGTAGKWGLLHDSVALVVSGRFRAPRVMTGKGTDIGAPLRDASGALRAGELQDVPFVVTIPKGVDLAKAPVVLVSTGLTGTMGDSFFLAETFSRAGAVSVSIEPALHGSRASSAVDKRNTFRDLDGPDGLMEHDSTDVGGRFVGFVGAEPGKSAWPGYVLGVTEQQAADIFAAFRLLAEGDWSAFRKVPSLETLSFDPARIAYFGISNGSIIGTKLAIAQEGLAAAVLDVAPPSAAETLFIAPGFRQVAGLSLFPNLDLVPPDDPLAIRFDPLFDTYRWALDPVDPLALAPYFDRAPVVTGDRPDVLVQHGGADELVPPVIADDLASAIGFPTSGPYTFAPVTTGTLPFVENVTTNGKKRTAGSVRFPTGTHLMVAYAQDSSNWLTLAPPYQPRPMSTMVDDPVVQVQKQLETFYRARFTAAHATIE